MRSVNIPLKDGSSTAVNVLTVDEYISGGYVAVFSTSWVKQYRRDGAISWVNVPFTFDIETSHEPWRRDEKGRIDASDARAWMYVWQMTIAGQVVMGRSWDEWKHIMKYLHDALGLNDERRAVLYVHNLSYEWAFCRKHIPVGQVFAREARKPIKVDCIAGWAGWQIRCSYVMSGYSLAAFAKNTADCPVAKLKGDLDYDKLILPSDELTDAELAYCVNDVLILHHCITAWLNDRQRCKNIADLSLTATGFVRKAARKAVRKDDEHSRVFHRTRLTAEQYRLYNSAFRGGDTHAHAFYVGRALDEVYSADLTSSYPWQLFAEQYPTSKPVTIKNVTPEQYSEIVKRGYLHILTVWLKDVKIKDDYTGYSYIPRAKCNAVEGAICENGRIVSADALIITVTSVDWDIIRDNYDYNVVGIPALIYHHRKGFLSQSFRTFMLDLYKGKTELKGVAGREADYQRLKSMLNSLYGMCVCSITQNEITYDAAADTWQTEILPLTASNDAEIQDALDMYYRKRTSFLEWEIGVFCTAYARADLHKALKRIGSDAVYWDTDSVKFVNAQNMAVFASLNAEKLERMEKCGFDKNAVQPKNKDNRAYPLGLWDIEHDGKPFRFKTWGAKKYISDYGDKLEITISGVNKATGAAYLMNKKRDVLDEFDLDLCFGEDESGRTIATYHDDGFSFEPRGDGERVTELSWVTISPTTYTLGITSEFENYINELQRGAK